MNGPRFDRKTAASSTHVLCACGHYRAALSVPAVEQGVVETVVGAGLDGVVWDEDAEEKKHQIPHDSAWYASVHVGPIPGVNGC
jgi:hypothetical protein